MDPIIFHIDVNSAFLSWTALKLLREGSEVDLRTIPSIVGGDQKTRHGIVVAKSIPAKKYGIRTADTVASAFQKCPNLVNVPADHAYYRECSQKLMDYLRRICPNIEQVSIDECYMDFEPIRDRYESPEACARMILDGVYETFGFTVNIGISDRKVLAKTASDFTKPNRVHTLYASEIREKLWPLPIEELYMCGKSSAALFRKMGIRTVGDLARTDPNMVESWKKKHGIMLWNFANGIDESVVNLDRGPAKGVGNSTTLSEDVTDRETAYEILRRLAESVGGRLRKKGFVAAQISTEIKYATFQSVSHQTTLVKPTDSDDKIYRQACELFDELWNGDPVRLLGIRTTKLEEKGEPMQMTLFDYQESRKAEIRKEREQEQQRTAREKQQKLQAAMENIQARFGTGAISKGVPPRGQARNGSLCEQIKKGVD